MVGRRVSLISEVDGMKKLAYFPGCTVKTTGLSMETSAQKVLSQLGFELAEMPNWSCCGVASPLAEDNLMHHLASVRNLIHAGKFCEEIGADKQLVTLCSVCYNTLKRTEVELAKNPDKMKTISFFLGEDSNKEIQTASDNGKPNFPKVVHLLQVLDKKAVEDAVKYRLDGLKVLSYYGCALTRPESVKVDGCSLESPMIMEGLVSALGATPVNDPYKTECCGSYHIVSDERVVKDSVGRIINSARKRGVDAIITACPLCSFNIEKHSNGIPVLYFTELLELAFFGKTATTGFEFSGGKLKNGTNK